MAGPKVDFGFGFNDVTFSDWILHIEVIEDSLNSEGDCITKRKSSGNDLDKENVVQVKTLHINSLVLAASSPFFYKLFKNGMRESYKKDVTLRINASEDGALMEILKFIYNNTLSATLPDLLSVLMVEDKFEVTSCMRYCSELLKEQPMSLESALLYLELPASVSLGEVVQPLLVAAKEYIVSRYSDFNKSENEVMDLPLCAVEVVLRSDGFQVDLEDDVFDFILEWACVHYPKLEERLEILTKRLVQYICFQQMSCSKLKEVLVCPDFGHEEVSKLVLEALFSKVEVPYFQLTHASKDLATTKCRSLVRIYNHRPVQVVQLEFPQPRCIVYFDLKKEECENLFPTRFLYSQSFLLGGQSFYFLVQCEEEVEQQTLSHKFGLYVHMEKESETCSLDFEFAVMEKPSKEFQSVLHSKANCSDLTDGGWGYLDLFDTSWTDFMSKDSKYFIEGILHLRADLTLNISQA